MVALSQPPTCPLRHGKPFDSFDAVAPILRLRQTPVLYEPPMDVWFVTRYADVMESCEVLTRSRRRQRRGS